MPRTDGRIEKGQSIRSAISARAWNRAQDAADIVLGATPGVEVDPATLGRALNIALVRNDAAVTVPAYGALAITGLVTVPSTTTNTGTIGGTDIWATRAREFVRRPVFTAAAPSQGFTTFTFGDISRVCVALEPVLPNAIGRFAVGGLVVFKLKILSLQHTHARGRIGDVTQLVSADCGPVKILHRIGNVGDDRWAVGVL